MKGLMVIPSTKQDMQKLIKWEKNSDYYAEINNIENYLFFPEENVDELEMELEKEFNKLNINVHFELQENYLKEKIRNYKGSVNDFNKLIQSYIPTFENFNSLNI